MKAFIINPELQSIEAVRYDAIELGTHANVLRYLIGENFQFEHTFANGDCLYTADNSQHDMYNIAFELEGFIDLLYGRAVLISFNAHDGSLKNPITTLEELQSKIAFYTVEETLDLRAGELLRQLGCSEL